MSGLLFETFALIGAVRCTKPQADLRNKQRELQDLEERQQIERETQFG